MNGQIDEEDPIRERYSQRIEEMRRSKEKQLRFRANLKKYGPPAATAAIVLILVLARVLVLHTSSAKPDGKEEIQQAENTNVNNQNIENQNTENPDTDNESAGSQNTDIPDNGGQSFGSEGSGTDPDSQQAAESAVVGLTESFFSGLEKLPSVIASQGKEEKESRIYSARATNDTDVITDEDFYSQYAIMIDLEKEEILAGKDAFTVINPASMTKILTALVAAEHVEDLDDTFTITLEITDYGYVHDCSSAGFEKDEVVTIRDLFYGTILPSGADAAMALAVYVAGDHESFVEMMNDKLKELGLSKTAHFTNCVGIYDEDHHCTVYDMAMILEAALDNELCREVLSTKTYTTSETEQHPEGIIISNWFLRRIEDKDCGGEVLSGKTGYVVQSGNCAASYGVDQDGKGFVCVTAGANSAFRCIADHAVLYKRYMS